MSKFRPCIDLHEGKVKQIVGGTLADSGAGPRENFVSDLSAKDFAKMFREKNLTGGHVIQLGKGNEKPALEALSAWRGGFQIGGGINSNNAEKWLEAGASHVIITSYLFDEKGSFLEKNLSELVKKIGREKIVIDLSCRRTSEGWIVAMNRWQTLTNLKITPVTLNQLAEQCDEFLIHAADVEGLCSGVDQELVELLGDWAGKTHFPITYAGGISTMNDIQLISEKSQGKLDFTVGSALDVFGGDKLSLVNMLSLN